MSARGGWPEAERAAREAYGKLLAWLAWRWRDLAAAEDALAEALLRAVERWPRDGVPARPEAWLLAVAVNELRQGHRRATLAASPEVLALLEEAEPSVPGPDAGRPWPDRRLALLFACAHPALPEAQHAPLMLQAVLGLEAASIARVFLVAPATMAQRLVRAKARLREAGARFELPEPDAAAGRLSAVHDALYAAFTIGHDLASPAPEAEPALREEVIHLARLLVQLQAAQGGAEAESLGLLALLLHAESRRDAMFTPGGEFVPLARQDPARWRRDWQREAEAALWQAASLRRMGPYQLEAAIQSAHNQRAWWPAAGSGSAATPWPQIAALYGQLRRHHDGIGARIGHAVALGESGSAAAGLALLAGLPEAGIRNHQPYWVALAHLHALASDPVAAETARQRAVGLTADMRVRRFLQAAAPPAHEGS